ncbi:1611_t:CDS:2, partial [Funneliformis geosporum]
FLNESSDIEPFDLKIDFYIKSLESIFDHEQGSRKQRARTLLDNYRKAITNQCWGTGGLLGCLMFKATGWTDWIETWNMDDEMPVKNINSLKFHARMVTIVTVNSLNVGRLLVEVNPRSTFSTQ